VKEGSFEPIPAEPLDRWFDVDRRGVIVLSDPIDEDVALSMRFGRPFRLPDRLAGFVARIHDGTIAARDISGSEQLTHVSAIFAAVDTLPKRSTTSRSPTTTRQSGSIRNLLLPTPAAAMRTPTRRATSASSSTAPSPTRATTRRSSSIRNLSAPITGGRCCPPPAGRSCPVTP
jgi:hypothetical protein